MEFLKKYTSHEEYEVDKTPNVSLCVENNEKHLHYTKKNFNDEYLTFEALESGTFTLTIGSAVSTSVLSSISYSIDGGETWVTTNNVNSQAVTITTPTVTAGNAVMWKGSGTGVSTTVNNNDRPSTSSIFSSTGTFNAKGNILSLIYGDDFEGEDSVTGTYNFACLFYSYNIGTTAKVVSCDGLVLPIKNVPDFCYLRVFQGCTTLVTPMRIIDAESIGNSGCFSMFYACSGLLTAPKLPAMSLGAAAYRSILSNCTSLTKAPELPATTVPTSGYMQTFYNCRELTDAPELPATNLGDACYGQMFAGCSGITVATELPATTVPLSGYTYMFSGCTSLTIAPELPAMTLANYCYQGMFSNCSKLTVAPKLPATTLANNCYAIMFGWCTNLTTAPELSATTLAYACYASMFRGCTNLTVAPKLPATTLAVSCYDGMFWVCSNLKILPELPATTLTNGCYAGMFRGTAVEESPILSASTLVTSCYSHLFMECPNIKKVTCLATDVSAEKCIEDWITGNGQNGTFVKAPSMEDWPSGASGIPTGWNVEDYAVSPI